MSDAHQPESGWAPSWRKDVGSIHPAQPELSTSCETHPDQPSGTACRQCNPPQQQTIIAPLRLSEVTVGASVVFPAKRGDWCPRHAGGEAGNCRGCRADELAGTPSPHPDIPRPDTERIELVKRYLTVQNEHLRQNGGACDCCNCRFRHDPSRACEKCRDKGCPARVWENCDSCGSGMHPRDRSNIGGICRKCADIIETPGGQLSTLTPNLATPIRKELEAMRTTLQNARATVRRQTNLARPSAS